MKFVRNYLLDGRQYTYSRGHTLPKPLSEEDPASTGVRLLRAGLLIALRDHGMVLFAEPKNGDHVPQRRVEHEYDRHQKPSQNR